MQCCAVDVSKSLGGMFNSPYLCNVIQKHRPQAPYPPKGAAVRNISASRSRHEGFTKGCRRVRGRKVCPNTNNTESTEEAPQPPKGAAVRNISASRSRHEGFTKRCRRVRGRKVCTNTKTHKNKNSTFVNLRSPSPHLTGGRPLWGSGGFILWQK